MLTTLRRPWAVWLALCMALLGALAPTLSHALVWAQGGQAPLVEICTSAGPRWMALSGVTTPVGSAQLENTQAATNPDALAMRPDGPLSSAVFDHCPFCLLFSDRVAPPPQAWQIPLVLVQMSAVPVIPQAYFLPVFYAHTPPPRGPPAFF